MMNYWLDLDAHELVRQAAMLEALGDLYDPTEIAEQEAEARALLYGNLSSAQASLRTQLIEAGVLDA